MPIYEYRKLEGEKGCAHCSGGFETFQPMSDASLEKCPECGGGVQRVISAVNIVTSTRSMLSDKNLKAHGFQKLVKEQKGRYRRTTT